MQVRFGEQPVWVMLYHLLVRASTDAAQSGKATVYISKCQDWGLAVLGW